MQQDPDAIRFPPDPLGKGRTPRCLGCGYRLIGLEEQRCPECGREFYVGAEVTFSRKAPFIWYVYWWPGALMAIAAGLAWSVAFYTNNQLGWGLFIAVPFMIGALVGYRPAPESRVGWAIARVAVVVCGLLLVLLLFLADFAGVFCGLLLMLVFIVPTIGGFYFGIFGARILSFFLKRTRFSQRDHLPLVFGLLLLPGVTHLAERLFAPPIKIETVQTAEVLEMDRMQAWDAWVFYEEVKHQRPLILRLGLPTPSHVEGRIQAAGDTQMCVYTGSARLVKMATEVTPGKRLAFDVVRQQDFENNSVRLIDGAFDFKPIDPQQTQVSLTTRYEPMLRPRALWRPIEHTFAHELHRHVLKGMAPPREDKQYTHADRSTP